MPRKRRPDFRLLMTWLWSDSENIESDGNYRNPPSKEWTGPYIRHRRDNNFYFESNPVADDPLVLEIKSTNKLMLNKVGYFMQERTDGELSESFDCKRSLSKNFIRELIQSFSVDDANDRVASSRYIHTTKDDPYPKL